MTRPRRRQAQLVETICLLAWQLALLQKQRELRREIWRDRIIRATVPNWVREVLDLPQAAASLIQQSTASGTTGGPAPALSGTIAGNTLILLYCGQESVNGNAIIKANGVTDTQGNTWTLVKTAHTFSTLGAQAEIWVASSIVGGAGANTLTIATTGTTQGTHAYLNEWSGLTGTTDGTVAGGAASGNTIDSTNNFGGFTTTNANDVIFDVAGATASPTISAGPTNSFIALTQPANVVTPLPMASYRIVTATGEYHPTWTISNSVQRWACAAAAFKQSAIAHSQTLSATAAVTVSIAKQVGKILPATGAGNATLVKQVGKILSVMGAGAATLKKQVGKIIFVTGGSAASIAAAAAHFATLQATAAGSPTLIKQTGKALTTASAAISTMMRSISKAISAPSAGSGSISRATSKTVVASVGANPALSRQVGKVLTAAPAGAIASFTKQISKILSAITQAIATLSPFRSAPGTPIFAQATSAVLVGAEGAMVNSLEVSASLESPIVYSGTVL